MRIAELIVPCLILFAATTAAADDVCPSGVDHLDVIVLDPGHGGTNEGAVGVAGTYERFLTMDTAKRLQSRLQACYPDLEVWLTRETDVDVGLSERTAAANARRADLFLSLHYNAAVNAEANGIEVYYLSSDEPEPDAWDPGTALIAPHGVAVASILVDLGQTHDHAQSAALAAQLLDPLIAHSGANDRGVRQAQFRVLRGALMPAVVVELGFLTHNEEGKRILDPDYRDLLVGALIEGIAAYDAGL